jgi:serine/threonine protein phosphatase PrpC
MVGRTLYVSNVGDSRAIILSKSALLSTENMQAGADITAKLGEKKRLLATPLSSDQTPYRKDERERVMRRGARVLTQDQIDGVKPVTDTFDNLTLGDAIDEDGDPPRVWSTQGNYPGTAFTRSFGDSVAETIGVFAEPEILTRCG